MVETSSIFNNFYPNCTVSKNLFDGGNFFSFEQPTLSFIMLNGQSASTNHEGAQLEKLLTKFFCQVGKNFVSNFSYWAPS